MKISKIWYKDLPEELTVVTVAIDAYAASSNMSILLSKNPAKIIIANENNLDEVKASYPDLFLAGESDADLDFDVDNSLKAMSAADVEGKNVAFMSINGSRVFEKAFEITDGQVILAAFNNNRAVVDYLKKADKQVNIIMSGNRKNNLVVEDKLCADLIEKRTLGQGCDWSDMQKQILEFTDRFYPPPYTHEDGELLINNLDKFNFVPKLTKNGQGFLEVVKA